MSVPTHNQKAHSCRYTKANFSDVGVSRTSTITEESLCSDCGQRVGEHRLSSIPHLTIPENLRITPSFTNAPKQPTIMSTTSSTAVPTLACPSYPPMVPPSSLSVPPKEDKQKRERVIPKKDKKGPQQQAKQTALSHQPSSKNSQSALQNSTQSISSSSNSSSSVNREKRKRGEWGQTTPTSSSSQPSISSSASLPSTSTHVKHVIEKERRKDKGMNKKKKQLSGPKGHEKHVPRHTNKSQSHSQAASYSLSRPSLQEQQLDEEEQNAYPTEDEMEDEDPNVVFEDEDEDENDDEACDPSFIDSSSTPEVDRDNESTTPLVPLVAEDEQDLREVHETCKQMKDMLAERSAKQNAQSKLKQLAKGTPQLRALQTNESTLILADALLPKPAKAQQSLSPSHSSQLRMSHKRPSPLTEVMESQKRAKGPLVASRQGQPGEAHPAKVKGGQRAPAPSPLSPLSFVDKETFVVFQTTRVPFDFTNEKYAVSRNGQRLVGAELTAALAARDSSLSAEEKTIASHLMKGLCDQAKILTRAKKYRDKFYTSSINGQSYLSYPLLPRECDESTRNKITRASKLYLQAYANFEEKVGELLKPQYAAIMHAHRKGIWKMLEEAGVSFDDSVKRLFLNEGVHKHVHSHSSSSLHSSSSVSSSVSKITNPTPSSVSAESTFLPTVDMENDSSLNDETDFSHSVPSREKVADDISSSSSSYVPPWRRQNKELIELRKTIKTVFVSNQPYLAEKLTDDQRMIIQHCVLYQGHEALIPSHLKTQVEVKAGPKGLPFFTSLCPVAECRMPLKWHRKKRACLLPRDQRPIDSQLNMCIECSCVANHDGGHTKLSKQSFDFVTGPRNSSLSSLNDKTDEQSQNESHTSLSSSHQQETILASNDDGEERELGCHSSSSITDASTIDSVDEKATEELKDEEDREADSIESAIESAVSSASHLIDDSSVSDSDLHHPPSVMPKMSMMRAGPQKLVIHDPPLHPHSIYSHSSTVRAREEKEDEDEGEISTDSDDESEEDESEEESEEEEEEMQNVSSAAHLPVPLTRSSSTLICGLYIEELVSLGCSVCPSCDHTIAKHGRRPITNAVSTQSQHMTETQQAASLTLVEGKPYTPPRKSDLPVWKDKNDSTLSDPETFIVRFEDALRLYSVPRQVWFALLGRQLQEHHLVDWVRQKEQAGLAWSEVRTLFISDHTDPHLVHKIETELSHRRQRQNEPVFDYVNDFQRLCRRVKFDETQAFLIRQMEEGLQSEVREQLRLQLQTLRLTRKDMGLVPPPDRFPSLKALADAAVEADKALKTKKGNSIRLNKTQWPRVRNTKVTESMKKKRKRSNKPSVKRAKVEQTQASNTVVGGTPVPTVSTTLSSSAPATTVTGVRLAKLETIDGKPVNVNKKPSKKVKFNTTSSKTQTEVKLQQSCSICGLDNHNTIKCFRNQDSCIVCGGKGHRLIDCSQWKAATIKICRAPLVPSTLIEERHQKALLLTCAQMKEPCTSVLLDTGAEFSAISDKLVQKYKLKMHKPSKGIHHLLGAAAGMSSERKGYVILDVTVHFAVPYGRQAISFRKQFEVMDLDNEDFIIGMDLAPELFPEERCWKHGASWAKQMTTWPTKIVRHSIQRPRSAVLNAAYGRSVSEQNSLDDIEATLSETEIEREKEGKEEEQTHENESSPSSSSSSSSD